jgi:hypothetical protein
LLHLPSDGRPSHPGFDPGNADMQQRHMGTDAVVYGVVHGPQAQGALSGSKGAFDFQQKVHGTVATLILKLRVIAKKTSTLSHSCSWALTPI